MPEKTYPEIERRKESHLTDDQIEAIAEVAATKAMEKLTSQAYQAIGKGVVSRFLTLVGVISLAAYFWLNSRGYTK